MDLQQLSIGQMARLNHVSEQTLRLYDKMNLLKPVSVNSETGYRYYSIGQSATLDMIQYYKEIGIPLKAIQARLNEMNVETMPEILKDRYNYIDKEMQKLKINQAAILRSIENFNRYLTIPHNGRVFCEYIPERRIYVYNTGANLFSYSYYDYEYYLRMFKDFLIENDFPISYFSNVGTIMRNEHIVNEKIDFFSDEIFIFIDDTAKCPLETEIVPAGTYMSMCCNVFAEEMENALGLFDEVRKNNFKILGDYLCEVVAEYPNSENGQREIFYKVQVRVK